MSLVSVCSMTLPISMNIHSSLARRAWAMLWVTIRIEYFPRSSQISSSTAAVPFGPKVVLRERLANQLADVAIVFNCQNVHLDPVFETLKAPYKYFVTVS
jgi:hypothetical protein